MADAPVLREPFTGFTPCPLMSKCMASPSPSPSAVAGLRRPSAMARRCAQGRAQQLLHSCIALFLVLNAEAEQSVNSLANPSVRDPSYKVEEASMLFITW